MEVKANIKNHRISAQKARLVTNVVSGMMAKESVEYLANMNDRPFAKVLAKLINSDLSNASNNFELDEDNMYIKSIIVGEGPTLKRWKPRSRGRADRINRRTSKIEVVLEEKVKGKKAKKTSASKVADKKADTSTTKEAKEEAPKKKKDERTGYFQQGEKKGAEGFGKKGKAKKGFLGKFFRRKSGE